VNRGFAKEQSERELRHMREDHQLLVLKVLFTEEQVRLLQNNTERFFNRRTDTNWDSAIMSRR